MTATRRATAAQGTIGTPEHTLITAALESLKIPLVNGRRPGDPLTALVTEDSWQDWRPVAEFVVEANIARHRSGELMAARVRATVRRWTRRGLNGQLRGDW